MLLKSNENNNKTRKRFFIQQQKIHRTRFSYLWMAVSGKINSWETIYQKHKEKQLINPFSEWEGASHREALAKTHDEYGRPITGTDTEIRGRAARRLMSHEVDTLVYMIKENGKKVGNQSICITFGELFQLYVQISNKLVGALLRARKYGLVDFKGEMLFQRRDEETMISLNLSKVKEIGFELKEKPRPITYDTLLSNLKHQIRTEENKAERKLHENSRARKMLN